MATVTCTSRDGLKKYELGNLALSVKESGEITICAGNNCQAYSAEQSEDLRTLFEALKIKNF